MRFRKTNDRRGSGGYRERGKQRQKKGRVVKEENKKRQTVVEMGQKGEKERQYWKGQWEGKGESENRKITMDSETKGKTEKEENDERRRMLKINKCKDGEDGQMIKKDKCGLW